MSSLRRPKAIWRINYANTTLEKEITVKLWRRYLTGDFRDFIWNFSYFPWHCVFKTILLSDLSFSELLFWFDFKHGLGEEGRGGEGWGGETEIWNRILKSFLNYCETESAKYFGIIKDILRLVQRGKGTMGHLLSRNFSIGRLSNIYKVYL